MALGACVASADGAIVEPKVYDNASFQALSADGRFAVSELSGIVTIYDFKENKETVFEPNGEYYYGVGLGSCLTASGDILVGNTKESVNAAYYDGESWKELSVPNPEGTNLANSITPDGSRICGSVGFHEMSLDDAVLMQAPVYWDRNEDGGYGECHLLPYPQKDLYGSTPQYVTAIAISDDGKTIAGQVVDCRGMMVVPIVYKQADNGEWSYTLPTGDLFNPEGLEPVADPGDGPACPSQEQYMTQEEIDAYNAAYNEWVAGGYNGAFPEYTDYMTEDEQAAYVAAYDKWVEEFQDWDEKYQAFDEYYFGVYENSPTFLFNSELLSGDGSTIAVCATTERFDPNSWFGYVTVCSPWTLDLASGDVVKYEYEKSLVITGLADDGVLLAGTEIGTFPMEGFVLRDGEVTDILDYLAALSPEYTDWFKKNMTHEVLTDYVYNEEDDEWEEVFEELTYTGMPHATRDMKVLTLWNDASWDMSYSMFAQGVMLDLSGDAGSVESVSASGMEMYLDAMGTLHVADDVVSVAVYDIAGACVASETAPAGTVALQLGHGVYVVKAQHADGATEVLKIAR